MHPDTEGAEHLEDDRLKPTCEGMADIPEPFDDDQEDEDN
jgi:hypothetical protein